MAGRKEQRGAAMRAEKEDFMKSFIGIVIFFNGRTFCFGIIVFCFSEMIIEDAPNKPVRRGRRGSFTGRLNVAMPRKPARKNITRAGINSFSVKIK